MTTTPPDDMPFEPLVRLRKDIKAAATTLSVGEVRFLVDYYYAMQEDRIRSMAQWRGQLDAGEPSLVLQWLTQNTGVLERNIKSALGAYADSQPVGQWSQAICGIGPILAAGLLAHIDITKAPTVGHIWRFAGLDPTRTWEKKTKRPWNAALKVLCWKAGESFVKVSTNKADLYGHLYAERKLYEQQRNEAGELASQAAEKLVKFKIGKDTEAHGHYAAGRLPPAHLHARAKRWAVKLFLSHWHEAAYVAHYGELPPKPYALTEAGGHAHEVVPPFTELIPGWTALRAR